MIDLRDQIAEAIYSGKVSGPPVPWEWILTDSDFAGFRADAYQRADAVLAVVQPELDERDDEIARLREALRLTDAMREENLDVATAAIHRVEQAEADMRAAVAEGGRLTVLRNAADAMARIRLRMVNTQRQRTERAEAALERVREVIHIADRADVTDWQRGYRACADRVVGAVLALDQPEESHDPA